MCSNGHGIPVTDEVLTQCIKTLRRQLGDSATEPHFIETVPKHGYRFIAAVAWVDSGTPAVADPAPDPAPAADPVSPSRDWRQCWLTLGAGTTGGGVAGLLDAAVGFADDRSRRFGGQWGWRRCVGQAALLGAVAGVAIEVSGGQLFGGSLVALVDSFPDARLHFDPLGSLPGPLGAALTSALEGAWFSACLVGALWLARR